MFKAKAASTPSGSIVKALTKCRYVFAGSVVEPLSGTANNFIDNAFSILVDGAIIEFASEAEASVVVKSIACFIDRITLSKLTILTIRARIVIFARTIYQSIGVEASQTNLIHLIKVDTRETFLAG
ncbi:MAG: hypothetical protein KDD45_07915 [Bdellovibrionales bacterium]|nr:hypothetical protein [Bdellovibrionales bacterium]